ncbi:MAG: 50S ribosomal protein L19 [Oligoflexales bacterium]
MRNKIITAFETKMFPTIKEQPKFKSGDTIKVEYKIVEGKKTRLQAFEGVVIRLKKGTVDSTFTVRKIGANGIGVERVFPVYSPHINSIEILSKGKVRRGRLFYLRDLSGKAARIKGQYVGNKKTDTTDTAATTEGSAE